MGGREKEKKKRIGPLGLERQHVDLLGKAFWFIELFADTKSADEQERENCIALF
jgi:hypothetical protein